MKHFLGHIVSGSLIEGLVMRVCSDAELELIKTGKFVSIIGTHYRFFSLITDLSLHVTNQDILLFPPTQHELLLHEALKKKDMYALAHLKPMLMLDEASQLRPVKTLPPHFAPVYEAHNKDVAIIFGDERDPSKRYFNIGTPLDMTEPVCLDLDRFTERSNGIFGKTGTGKTFLTRLVLAGLIKNEKAATLIFDMHSEYGFQARNENSPKAFVKGLKTLFADKIAIFSLDPASTRKRGGACDVEIALSYEDIHIDDLLSLQDELRLHTTAVEAAYLIASRYKKKWLSALLSHTDDLKEFARDVGAHPESVAALYRKLKCIEQYAFLKKDAPPSSIIREMIDYIDKGMSVIIEFGNYTSALVYLLIANIITRRIHTEYIEKTEQFLGAHTRSNEPKKLLICIEEAHKFLNPQAARQTIFGVIAREMRKYYVSLLVVDQRPSGIDQEIMSQIGTRIVAQLNDEKDIQAVLSGTHNSSHLRTILATLDSKKQALLFGHALTMPVVIQTREYNEAFYRAMDSISHTTIDEFIKEIF
ncbi:MAG: ATP-binding protein [Candidatus Babeliales bacterium]